jgi:hypothetical protein|tara:strand:- start:70 stop:378 length:309 start_codon:yes stop_codon:yes gene_type:complete
MVRYTLLLVVFLAACAQVPETPRQQLAAAEISFTNIVDQVGMAREAGLIEDTRYKQIYTYLQSAYQWLRVVRHAVRDDLPVNLTEFDNALSRSIALYEATDE